MLGLFITGTDTGVGKTHVAAGIVRTLRARGVRVGAYKPVCSGSVAGPDGGEVWEDVQALSSALGGEFPDDLIAPQRFTAAVAPPVAARSEGRTVDERLLASGAEAWRERGQVDLLIVEGAGGWLSPVSDASSVADLARRLDFPVLVVAANRLGVINHTLLTIAGIRAAGLPLAGVVLNQCAADGDSSGGTNGEEIIRRGNVSLLASLGLSELCCPPELARIDWFAVAGCARDSAPSAGASSPRDS